MRRVLTVPATAATLAAGCAVLAPGGGPLAAGVVAAVSAASPQVAIFPSYVSFGSQRVGSVQSQSVSVYNNGNAPLRVYSVTLNDYSGSYSLLSNTCNGATLSQGQLCRFTVEFHPRAPGQHSANALVTDNAPSGTQNVPIWGTASS